MRQRVLLLALLIIVVATANLLRITPRAIGASVQLQPTPPSTPLSTPKPPAATASTESPTRKDGWDIVQTVASVISSLFQAGALVVGAIWARTKLIKEREHYPRARLLQNVSHTPLTPHVTLVQVAVRIENIGKVALNIDKGRTWIQQVRPLDETIQKTLETRKGLVDTDRTEVPWPALGKCRETEACLIEPGETEEYRYDFIVSREIQTIRVYSYYDNITHQKLKIGWQAAMFYSLQPDTEESKTPPIEPLIRHVTTLTSSQVLINAARLGVWWITLLLVLGIVAKTLRGKR